MSGYYKFTFFHRWMLGFLVMLPIMALGSCFVGFVIAGEIWTGLAVWFGEAAVFGFLIALCPRAELFKRPWWEND